MLLRSTLDLRTYPGKGSRRKGEVQGLVRYRKIRTQMQLLDTVNLGTCISLKFDAMDNSIKERVTEQMTDKESVLD